MKTRNGFVSNSSSSSFIVCFKDGRPKDVVELQRLLFGTELAYRNPYPYDDDSPGSFAVSDVAGIVWNDLKKQRKMSVKDIAEAMDSYFSGNIDVPPAPKYPDYPSALYRIDDVRIRERDPRHIAYEEALDKHRKEYEEWRELVAKKFISLHPGEFYQFEYSDNGEGAIGIAMEHGDLFKNVPHIKVSRH